MGALRADGEQRTMRRVDVTTQVKETNFLNLSPAPRVFAAAVHVVSPLYPNFTHNLNCIMVSVDPLYCV